MHTQSTNLIMNDTDTTATTCANCGKGVKRALVTSEHVRHVIWSNIAIEIAKLHIVPYTKRHARNEQLIYMMKHCSKILRLVKIDQFASLPCQCDWVQAFLLSNHVVGKLYAMVVLLRCMVWMRKHVREVEK